MGQFRGSTFNENDTASTASISLNSSTATTILAVNGGRIFVGITNDSSQDVWVKLQAASVDNIKEGIMLPKKSYWEMIPDNMYTGEISAIAVSGTPDISLTYY